MKIIALTFLIVLISCSSNKKIAKKNMLLNTDCNPESARFSGKDYIQKDQRLNSVAFDQCTEANSTPSKTLEKLPSKIEDSGKNNALMYKCEVEVNQNNYAVSNKSRSSAKERVIKKCLTYEKNEECAQVRCSAL